jgi:DivIVA domain-containing protein
MTREQTDTPLTTEAIVLEKFTTTRRGERYREVPVDDLFDDAAATVRSYEAGEILADSDRVRSEQVVATVFPQSKGIFEGYEADQVDDFRAQVAATLRHYENHVSH